MSKQRKKIVCIGGGSGLSHFVKGIKDINYIDLKCIVTVADNGGSTGVLKEELNIPAVGDIRNVLVALSNVPEELSRLMTYRFDTGGLAGHSLGNLVLAGLLQTSNDDMSKTIKSLSAIFNVRGAIIPASNGVADIKATLEDNTEIIGEKNIGQVYKKIQTIEYLNDVKASQEAIEAIEEADILIYSIGSLYTSLIPNLIIPEINAAIEKSKASKVYFANLMSQPGETDNYSLSEYVEAINKHLGFNGIDYIIVNSESFSKKILNRYQMKAAYPVKNDLGNIDKKIKVIKYDIAKVQDNKIMHSPEKIYKLFTRDIRCLFPEK